MTKVKPIYKKLLIVAIIVYVIGNCIMLADLYKNVGDIKYYLVHKAKNH